MGERDQLWVCIEKKAITYCTMANVEVIIMDVSMIKLVQGIRMRCPVAVG